MLYAFARIAVLVVALPASALASTCREESTFLGFSDNEQGFAERVQVRCELRSGVTDRFTLARLYDSQTGRVRATFRVTAPERSLRDGSIVPVGAETFAANYPSFRDAMNRSAWLQLSHAARFHHVRHQFADDVVRLRAVDNSIESVHVARGVVTICPQSRQALRFVVTARAKNNEEFDVTTVRGAMGQQVRLEFFFSRSGHAVVVHVQAPQGPSMWLTRSAPLPAPIDSPDIGALNVMQWEAQDARRDYNSVGDGLHSDDVETLIDDAFHL